MLSTLRGQLFGGTALLAAALLLAQWAMERRQLQAIDEELGQAATTALRFMYTQEGRQTEVRVDQVPGGAATVDVEATTTGPAPAPTTPGSVPPTQITAIIEDLPHGGDGPGDAREITREVRRVERVWVQRDGEAPPEGDLPDVRVEAQPAGEGRVLVVHGLPGGDRRVPLTEVDRGGIVARALNQSLLATAVLLGLALLASAAFADRVTRPLRQLAAGADALRAGALGTQVEVDARGEIGELVTAFNRMSARLAALEEERARWQAREHLAELGDLSRGLAHTLRNPLHTLGLTVEELADAPRGGAPELVATARAQIQRIDRWLRSFLAVGAGDGARLERLDLREVVEGLALEAAGTGAPALALPDAPVWVMAVRPALHAALTNLLDNAAAASPPGSPVEIAVRADGAEAVIEIGDRGPGLPDAVRQRLFAPHTTTRAAGSGMGLYLARALIEGGHGGRLTLADRDGGGTLATARLPLAGDGP